MNVFSKIQNKNLIQIIYQACLGNSKKQTTSVIALTLFILLIKLKLNKGINNVLPKILKVASDNKLKKGSVDMMFIKKAFQLIKIAIPSWKSMEVLDLILLSAFLVSRTFLSIYIANVNGSIVNGVIKVDFKLFLQRLFALLLISLPASFVNSYLDYQVKRIALRFRTRLTMHFHEQYIKDMIFYQISNLDSRINNPDQRLTADIEKWCLCLSQLYTNLSKPLLDIVLFSRKLSEIVGWRGPFYMIIWYLLSGILLRFISPPFGKLTAIEQGLEGDYRSCHTDLLHHSEEIAFYKGQDWERNRINNSFDTLVNHQISTIQKKLYMGVFDAMLVKYGAILVGYSVVGLPVFGPGKEKYLKNIGSDPGIITRDYVRNSSLLINLAKAIGKIVVLYKEVQHLAGYTSLVYEINEVISQIQNGQYDRKMIIQENQPNNNNNNYIFNNLSRGDIIEIDNIIKFDDVPIISPNGDLLVPQISFEISPGMNCIINGPNGCGKSSLFRILGGLWPIFSGRVSRPAINKLFYIPQRPYLPAGTLRDQIIYPHSKLQMRRRKIKDENLKNILETVQIAYLIDREGGFDSLNDWNDVLSGGEKQRISMARLFYHKPQYAILDECTSAVSIDIEAVLYNHCKKLGITLLTVSHRTSLFKFHDYLLKFDGEGNWSFEKLIHQSNK